MKNVQQSLLVALCAVVSINIANATDTNQNAQCSIRAGGCMLAQRTTAQQTQPMSPQIRIKRAPINLPEIAHEPEVTNKEAQPMSPQIPVMQAPASMERTPDAAIEDTGLLAVTEQLPVAENTELDVLAVSTPETSELGSNQENRAMAP